MINAAAGVTIDHNTVFADGTSDLFADCLASTAFAFANDIKLSTASSPARARRPIRPATSIRRT